MEGITSMDRLKVVRSVKPYYFYLICEGLKKYEVGKDMPKNSDWDRTAVKICNRSSVFLRNVGKSTVNISERSVRGSCATILSTWVKNTPMREKTSVFTIFCRIVA